MIHITTQDAFNYQKLTYRDSPFTCKRAVAYTLTPSEEGGGWEDVTYYGEALINPTCGIYRPQWVYILVNEKIPGICKIGMTTTSVDQRVNEINSATGVITPWHSVYSFRCLDALQLERRVHCHLEARGYRVNPNREGFQIDSNAAILVIEQLAKELSTFNSASLK